MLLDILENTGTSYKVHKTYFTLEVPIVNEEELDDRVYTNLLKDEVFNCYFPRHVQEVTKDFESRIEALRKVHEMDVLRIAERHRDETERLRKTISRLAHERPIRGIIQRIREFFNGKR